MATDLTDPAPGEAAAPRRVALRKPPRRKPVKKATTWLHRWLSLVLGVILVVECTTGVALVYHQELERHLRGDVFLAPTDVGRGQSLADSLEDARAAYPDLELSGAYDDKGTHVAQDFDSGTYVTVDPRNGEVLGTFDGFHPPGGFLGDTLGLMYNIHLCGLTCEEYPGYQGWLVEEVPGTSWAGFENEEPGEPNYRLSWGGLLLAVTAVLLVFLGLTGIWLWWPTFRHFWRGVRIRFGKNRYARDYDLHQVVGMIALPLLLMWGLTGMSYELGFVEKGYYAALPGESEEREFVADEEATGDPLTYDEAVVVAREAAGADDDAPALIYEPPFADDPTTPHVFWFSVDYDPWAETRYPGDVEVLVDQVDPTNTAITYGGEDQSVAQTVYQDFNYPVHSGFFVNGWVRIIWVVLGLVPLLLMWTGISTWLFKRATRKRRTRAAAAA